MSALWQRLEGEDWAAGEEDEVSFLLASSDARTLRRFALLSLDEQCPNAAHYARMALDEVLQRKNSAEELGTFLQSSTVISALARSGALGHALSSCADLNVVRQLLPHTTPAERVRAAVRTFGAGKDKLDLLLRACQTDGEEAEMLQACLLVEKEEEQAVMRLISGLHCLRRKQLSTPLVLFRACLGANADMATRLLREFEWPSKVLEQAKMLWERARIDLPFPSLSAEGGTGEEGVLLECVRCDDAIGVHRHASAGWRPSLDALELAVRSNAYNALTALLHHLPKDDGSDACIPALLSLAAENGAMDAFSRLMRRYRGDVDQYLLTACAASSNLRPALLFTRELLARWRIANRATVLAACVSACDVNNAPLLRVLLQSSQPPSLDECEALLGEKRGQEECARVLEEFCQVVPSITLPSRTSLTTTPQQSLEELNQDVLGRVFAFLDLTSLARITQTCHTFAQRDRRREETVLCLVQDLVAARSNAPPSSLSRRFAWVYSSRTKMLTSFAFELSCKEEALRLVLRIASREAWEELRALIVQFGLDAAEGEVASILEILLQVQIEEDFAIRPEAMLAMLERVLRNERHHSLAILLKQPSKRWGGTRVFVEQLRQEAERGNMVSTSLLVATLSRNAMESRALRDAMIARRRADWEARGGVWAAHQQEEVAGATDAERDFDFALGGALRRAGAQGHSHICSTLLKMLNARNRLMDFVLDLDHVLESAARGGHEPVLRDVLQHYAPAQERAREDLLMTAARNGHGKVARLLVWERRLVSPQQVSFRFVECARKGHFEAMKTLLSTGAIGAGTCGDALEECTRRGHMEDCVPLLQDALVRLKRFEEEEAL